MDPRFGKTQAESEVTLSCSALFIGDAWSTEQSQDSSELNQPFLKTSTRGLAWRGKGIRSRVRLSGAGGAANSGFGDLCDFRDGFDCLELTRARNSTTRSVATMARRHDERRTSRTGFAMRERGATFRHRNCLAPEQPIQRLERPNLSIFPPRRRV